MKIPKSADALLRFADDTIKECRVSAEDRRDLSAMYRTLYFTGQIDTIPCRHNKCFTSVDKAASYLFSPAEARFAVTFEADETQDWVDIADSASRHINREFMRHSIDMLFAQGVDLALIEGCSFAKMNWRHDGYKADLIRQHQIGVLREDITDLDDQDAFTHSWYCTESQFKRLISSQSAYSQTEIMDKVQSGFIARMDDDGYDASYLHQIIVGGNDPLSLTGTPTINTGQVNIFARQPELKMAPEIATKLIQVHDLWVWDDEAEDWITIRYSEPGLIIEGKTRLQNLGDIPKSHPFVKICPNEVVGYMWGRSELANLAELQGLYNARIGDMDRIIRLKARPPRVFRNFAGVTAETALALYSPGGTLTDTAPPSASAVDTLSPDLPAELPAYIEKIEAWFDDQAGFTPILSGQGEQGVRGQQQANTMIRTSSPRLRDRALLVERQYGELGHKGLLMSQAKDAKIYKTTAGKGGVLGSLMAMMGVGKKGEQQQFLLSQLPDDATVMVDSHTSSPAFSGDNTNLAFALAHANAIDGEDLLDMTHPPNKDRLILRYRQRQEAQAQFVKEHPEVLTKGKGAAAKALK